MSDKIPELLPCPFCGESAEFDSQRGFADYKGNHRNQVAIYCVKCPVTLSFCYGDFPEHSVEELIHLAVETWNTRANLADELRKERDSALKREAVLRDAIKKWVDTPAKLFLENNSIKNSRAGAAMELREVIKNTPTPTNLVVLSVEDVRKLPCGCEYTYELKESTPMMTKTVTSLKVKCSRCQLLTQLEQTTREMK